MSWLRRDPGERLGFCRGLLGFSGAVIQPLGDGLNLNVHCHALLFDGVFCAESVQGALEFRPLPPPTDEEVGGVLARIAARVQRPLERRGLDPCDADGVPSDPVGEGPPVRAGIGSASILGRIALGPRAGVRVWRVGNDPDAAWVRSSALRHAQRAGFDLYANVAVPAADRTRLERQSALLSRPCSGGEQALLDHPCRATRQGARRAATQVRA